VFPKAIGALAKTYFFLFYILHVLILLPPLCMGCGEMQLVSIYPKD
jgi:hypothetical protein